MSIEIRKNASLAILAVSLSAGVFTLPANAATRHSGSSTNTSSSSSDDGESIGYDSIVNDLNREADRPALRARQAANRSTGMESILFHGGVGVAALMEMVTFEDGSQAYLSQKGIQASFGIDLFSSNWLAEGTARTFNEAEDNAKRPALQEFELKVIYRDRLSRQVGIRVGGGLSARYLSVKRPDDTYIYTTPTSVATMGLDIFMNDTVSFGFDLSGRSAMVADTPDKNSIDTTLRLDFHL